MQQSIQRGSIGLKHSSLLLQTQQSRPVQKGVWLFVLLLGWELLCRLAGISPLLLPAPTQIIGTVVRGFAEGTLATQLLQSISLVVVSLAAGLLLALVMAYIDMRSPWLNSLFDLAASVLHPLPGIAVLPVVILWVGIGLPAVFLVMIHAVLWSLFLNVQMGFRTVDRALIEVANNYGASSWQIYWHVLLPCSREVIKTGLQVAWSRGWRALISAEMIFGAINAIGGMGWYLNEKRSFMDTKGVFAGILVIALVGMVVENVLFRGNKSAGARFTK